MTRPPSPAAVVAAIRAARRTHRDPTPPDVAVRLAEGRETSARVGALDAIQAVRGAVVLDDGARRRHCAAVLHVDAVSA